MDYKYGFTHYDFSYENQESQWKTENVSQGLAVRTTPVIERNEISSWKVCSSDHDHYLG